MPTRAEQLARFAQLEQEAKGLRAVIEHEHQLIREAREERDRYLVLVEWRVNPLIKPVEEPASRRSWWRRLAG
jgi:heme-degrading monooxygenase HmoA